MQYLCVPPVRYQRLAEKSTNTIGTKRMLELVFVGLIVERREPVKKNLPSGQGTSSDKLSILSVLRKSLFSHNESWPHKCYP